MAELAEPRQDIPWDRVVADAAPRDHIVQLYQDQDFVNRAVCRFAGAALANGEGIILVPTLTHWRAIRPRLEAEGVDVDGARERGAPLSYWGGHMVVRRARARSGIARLHAHLFRHGMAQHAADNGADIGTIQTLLGHKTAAMARRYAGQALDRQGARLMVQYSPVG